MARVRQYPEETPIADLERRVAIIEGIVQTGAWRDWIPSFVNITLGNGSVVARYVQIGKTVHFYFDLLFGSTTTISANQTVSLPVEASSSYPFLKNVVGVARFDDDTGNNYLGWCRLESSTTFRPLRSRVNGAEVEESGVTTTEPFTWITGDRLFASGAYEGA